MATLSRRDFLTLSAKGMGAAAISTGLMGCDLLDGDNIKVAFNHGVASGDPTASSVILWTRVTPNDKGTIKVSWEIALDSQFNTIIGNGEMLTNADRDYTVKVDAQELDANTQYFYRFISNDRISQTGVTKTLPTGSVEQVKLAVMSCSNYPAGYFNVYELATQVNDLDAVIHLGDYIYEYDHDGYASSNAAALNREVMPKGELLTLGDYRTRYAQYHTDSSLQKLHSLVPFITVWDDHEVANDTYKGGAENHNEGEGDFDERKMAALQAYFEWLPIRPIEEDNESEIYRSFQFGDLVDLHMLDTRVLGRDKQLDYADYTNAETGAFDQETFATDMASTSRTMLGSEQLAWLQNQIGSSSATWQVLGQQVLMGKMYLPAAIGLQLMSVSEYAELGALAVLAQRAQAEDPTLTQQELIYLAENQSKLTAEKVAQLQLPSIPYNLDAWDGYAYEREVIYGTMKAYGKNMVVLAGDTHNAWANDLQDLSETKVGVEFATSSVSSPGLEYYLQIPQAEMPATETGIVDLVDGLKYCNLSDRGFLTVTFTAQQAKADWFFVDTITEKVFSELSDRRQSATVAVNSNMLTI